ncbi:MAG: Coenzyme F420 hydrogenase/dehydrogenase, beta subunit C-terminal domain [Fusobacterium sp. JB019]|nr:Coenzyme F420 hydrogenase/dehydrogenase, beta subunit C-terminal domain [Fusobacterium sp. JB019]
MIIEILDKKDCCGCNACKNICPVNCIGMKYDTEGFLFPIVDNSKCINCNACIEVCPSIKQPILNNLLKNPEIIAAYSKDNKNRINSTSGGMFTEIAKQVLKEKGVVFGAKYNKNFKVEHSFIENIKNLEELRQSKYVQSNMGDIYKKVKEFLESKRKVLFAGTPCHIAALKNFLKKDYDNLILVDFLCRGVISPKAYEQFLKSLENEYNSKIKIVWFKNKDKGWHKFSTKIIFENGKEYLKDRYHDVYMRGYLEGNLYIRKSCHNCKYKTLPRNSDVSLGDFWGIEQFKNHLDQDKGTSIFMINSLKGREVFNKIKDNLIYEKATLKDVYRGNSALTVSAGLNDKIKKDRKEFFDNYLKEDFSELVERILKKSFKEKFILILRKIINKIKRVVKKIIFK